MFEIEEMRAVLNDHCASTPCEECVFYGDQCVDEHDWDDGREERVKEDFYTLHPEERPLPPKLVEDFITLRDMVNHPEHYTHGGMECIDEMQLVFGKEAVKHFCLCNVWKYRKRALFKNKEEDLKKADWYMNKFKELSEDGAETNI
jgi:hypothetical protein